MSREASPWSTIGKIASLASILGLLAQIGVLPFLQPLTTAVPIPAWMLVAAFGLLLWLLPPAIGRAAGNATKDLSQRLETAQQRIQALENDNRQMSEAGKAADAVRAELAVARTQLSTATQRLDIYESLESEIMGLLRSGGEFDLLDIAQHTSAGGSSEGQRQVQRAIESLGEKIEGTGGYGKKYRMRTERMGP